MSRPAPIRSLTGVRFFAALAVVLFHNVAIAGAPDWFNRLLQRGEVAVPFFFALSGFVLVYNYALEPAPIDRRRFWIARFARLYPTYLLALVVALPLFARTMVVERHYVPAEAGQHAAVIAPFVLLMVQAWYPADELVKSWNIPGWSLSVEAFFYLAFPFLAAPVARARRPVLLALALAVLAVASSAVLPRVLPAESTFMGTRGRLLWTLNPLTHLATFALGMACARVFGRWRTSPTATRAAGPVSVIALAVVLAVVALTPEAHWFGTADAVLPALFAIVVLALAWDRGPLALVLRHPTILLLGEASYALYLLHSPFWAYLQFGWAHVLGLRSGMLADKPLVFDLTYVVGSVLASVVVYRWYEGWARGRVLAWLVPARAERGAVAGKRDSGTPPVIIAAATEPGP